MPPTNGRAAIEPARPIDRRKATDTWATRIVRDADDMIVRALREAMEEARDRE